MSDVLLKTTGNCYIAYTKSKEISGIIGDKTGHSKAAYHKPTIVKII